MVEVLCICTGNVSRSPVAERLLARAFPAVRVVSAGTGAPVGAPIEPRLGALLRERGIDAGDHTARWLTEADVQHADLVLGMAREHRGRAVELVPSALRRSFTLLEFAAIARLVPGLAQAASDDAGRLQALAELAPRYRQLVSAADIDDPYGRDDATHDRVFAEIVDAVDAIAAATAAPA